MAVVVLGGTYLAAAGIYSLVMALAKILLLTAHGRPFIGQLAVGPAALLQVMPDGP
jgi:hypothetical protein